MSVCDENLSGMALNVIKRMYVFVNKLNTFLMRLTQRKAILVVAILVVIACFFAVYLRLFTGEELWYEMFAAILGVIITAIITVLLLKGQAENEEKLEKSVKIFEYKQTVYHSFIEKIHEIVKDGEITINGNIDELKELIFQLGYMQMHASPGTMDKVLGHLSALIQQMNDFYSLPETEKQKEMAGFYARFSHELFNAIAAIKEDLYGEECHPIAEDRMNAILQDCGLFVETKKIARHELQCYFWDQIQKLLKNKGYEVEYKDFTQDVNEYYARARNRHRYFGISFPIYTTVSGQKVLFRVEIENRIYYGFRHVTNPEEDDAVCSIVSQVSNLCVKTPKWSGRKWTDRNNLDFWKLDSVGIKKLQDPRMRDKFIDELVNEMDMYIQKFISIAKEKRL